MTIKGLLNTACHALALLALLNAAAIGGLAAYGFGTGVLTRARVARLRQAWPEPAPTSQPAQPEAGPPVERGAKSAEAIAHDGLESELLWRERERVLTELQQKQQAIRAELVQVSQKRDAFEELKKREAENQKKLSQIQAEDGYKKQLEIVSRLSPKAAVEFLLSQQPADSARMMLTLDARQAKKIYEAAKTRAEKSKMSEILAMVREIAPGKADEVANRP